MIERIWHVCTGVSGSASVTGSVPTSHCLDQTPRVGQQDQAPASHCLDQTPRVGWQDQAERKRVGVLAENVSRFR